MSNNETSLFAKLFGNRHGNKPKKANKTKLADQKSDSVNSLSTSRNNSYNFNLNNNDLFVQSPYHPNNHINNNINFQHRINDNFIESSNSDNFKNSSQVQTSTKTATNHSFQTNLLKPNPININFNLDTPYSDIKDLTPIKEEENHFKYMDMNTTSSIASSISLNNPNNDGNNAYLTEDVFHRFHITNYLTPTYCDYCSLLLFGLIKQGLKCEFCSQNYHKRCVSNMPKICNHLLNIAIKGNNSKNEANFLNANLETNLKFEIEHTFIKKQMFNHKRLNMKCDICQHKFTNDKVYWQCKDCNQNVHQKCLKLVKKNCRPISINDDDSPSQVDDDLINSDETMIIDQTDLDLDTIHLEEKNEDITDISYDLANSKLTNENQDDHQSNGKETVDEDKAQSLNYIPGHRVGQFKREPKNSRKKQINLQRISQRVKKTDGCFWSGHMIYYTNTNIDRITHYWKLDSKSIIIYDTYRLERKLKELQLSDIRKATQCGVNLNSKGDEYINDQKCFFILRSDNEAYYCGVDNMEQNNPMNVLARNFYNIFKMAYLPYGGSRNGFSRVSLKITAPKYEEKNIKDEYVINPQDLLGSGQFGQVYGGICKANNQPVAIKVIDKTRFKDFHAETSVFQNEITILYNVQHPGIVKLFALFDEVEHLYIVTEKMATDMLEMILNKNPARLNERVSKFIIYQILIALNKLHDRKIAHCDLKPENILLTQNVEFPQVKLCDFGYAKIIGENSFRRSMVGTPAYSPPELKQKRLYNNSIDMWSMGVIIYVSLSGTFPFEEDRDIYEQILNSNFMFPQETWESVSRDAISLITSFLQVKIDRRMSVDKALQHKWFSEDAQLYYDLADLESRVQLKWLTTPEQEKKWFNSKPVHL